MVQSSTHQQAQAQADVLPGLVRARCLDRCPSPGVVHWAQATLQPRVHGVGHCAAGPGREKHSSLSAASLCACDHMSSLTLYPSHLKVVHDHSRVASCRLSASLLRTAVRAMIPEHTAMTTAVNTTAQRGMEHAHDQQRNASAGPLPGAVCLLSPCQRGGGGGGGGGSQVTLRSICYPYMMI